MATYLPYHDWGTGSSGASTWITWLTNNTTANNTIASNAFQIWTAGTNVQVNVWNAWNEPPPLTSEQAAASAARAEQEAAARQAADERADALLREHLSRRQRRDLDRYGFFHVHTRRGERVYRIRQDGLPTRVKGEDGNRYSYCIHPYGSWPPGDKALAVKLLLEADEEQFLEIANASRF